MLHLRSREESRTLALYAAANGARETNGELANGCGEPTVVVRTVNDAESAKSCGSPQQNYVLGSTPPPTQETRRTTTVYPSGPIREPASAKMVAKNSQAVTKAAAPRLPPLPRLRVRRPNAQASQGPCVGIMTTVLACWASSGHAAQACAMLEQQLRTCMDAPRANTQKKSSINYHLGRFYPQIVGPTKKK